MFSVQRFDGAARSATGHESVAGPSGSGPSRQPQTSNPLRPPVDRIALLNAKKASQAASIDVAAAGQDGPASISHIHPSRLAQSHVLRHSDRKIRSSLQPGSSDKTKAKQRYLNRKKERRKKREKTKKIKTRAEARKVEGVATNGVAIGKGESQPPTNRTAEKGGVSDDSSDEGEGDSEHTQDDPMQNLAKPSVNAAESASSSSSSSSSASSSEDDEDDEEEEVQPRTKEDIEEAERNALAAEAAADEAMADDALQRFPAPRATRLASRKDLAAQGLPEGLARPQYVKPSLSATVKKGDTSSLDMISEPMRARLAKLGIERWFAVQTAIIPMLLGQPNSYSLYPSPPLDDVCVSAPTGSGKTLSYAVPIVEVLSRRVHKQLRALILVPTRDLVHQVRETITSVSKGTSLTVASLTGQQSFAHEQTQLMDMRNMPVRRNVPGLKPLVPGSEEEAKVFEEQRILMNGPLASVSKGDEVPHANADIVIATPGRLIDHLEQTPGFTLQHLRFLIVDEADRLLSQSFQEWLPRLLAAIDPEKGVQALLEAGRGNEIAAPSWLARKDVIERSQGNKKDNTFPAQHLTAFLPRRESTVQKLLFSATLTRDPARIVALDLREAAFISVEGDEKDAPAKSAVANGHAAESNGQIASAGDEQDDARDWQESFALPASLSEHMVVVSAQDKPLHLLHLLATSDVPLRHTLCFTKSLESAARLVKLLDLFQESRQKRLGEACKPFVAKEYSSEQSAGERSRLLEAFSKQEIDVLVCSDVMARGIDLPSVRHVVSYDVPSNMANYVHRVGRTARAGRDGDAWTLVELSEARHFTQMMRRAQRWDRIHKERRAKTSSSAKKRDASAMEVDGEADAGEPELPERDPRYVDLEADYKAALKRLEKLYSRKRRAA